MSERQAEPAAIREQLEALHRESFAWATACCAHAIVEPEDVLQMTYVKILDGRARFEGRSTFKTWLFGVIRMTAREQRRRAWWRWIRSAPLEDAEEHHARGDAPDVAATTREAFEQVRAACLQLPARQHEVLMLVFHHGVTLDEAAAVMGVSAGSARKHYQRGKEQLRVWLANLHPAS